MEKRIELEKRGKDPSEITELCLDNCRSPNIVGLTDEFVNLETLSLSNVGLTNLKGFPKLPNLKKLDLSQNRISNGLSVLQSSPKLNFLNIAGNKIKDLESLDPLKDCKNLKTLEVSSNEAASIEDYRKKVFELIPQLKIVDGYNANQESDDSEIDDEELNGNDEASVDGEDDDDDDEEGDEEAGDEEEDGEDGDEAEDDDDDEIGLESVYKADLDEESEGDDYEVEGDGEEDEDGIDDEEESENEVEGDKEDSIVRGKKRKHEEEDEGE